MDEGLGWVVEEGGGWVDMVGEDGGRVWNGLVIGRWEGLGWFVEGIECHLRLPQPIQAQFKPLPSLSRIHQDPSYQGVWMGRGGRWDCLGWVGGIGWVGGYWMGRGMGFDGSGRGRKGLGWVW